MTRVTVLEADTKSPPSKQSRRDSTKANYPSDLESAIIRLVEQDPFASISEIKLDVNNGPGNHSASWWQVFKILRQRKLLTKRSRFKYILGRR